MLASCEQVSFEGHSTRTLEAVIYTKLGQLERRRRFESKRQDLSLVHLFLPPSLALGIGYFVDMLEVLYIFLPQKFCFSQATREDSSRFC